MRKRLNRAKDRKRILRRQKRMVDAGIISPTEGKFLKAPRNQPLQPHRVACIYRIYAVLIVYMLGAFQRVPPLPNGQASRRTSMQAATQNGRKTGGRQTRQTRQIFFHDTTPQDTPPAVTPTQRCSFTPLHQLPPLPAVEFPTQFARY